MGAIRRIGIITAVTIGTFYDRNIIVGPFSFAVGTQQADYRKVSPFTLHRMEGRIVRGELDPFVGGPDRQVGTVAMAQIAQFVFFGYGGVEVADPLSPDPGIDVVTGNVMGVVAIDTYGMARCCGVRFGQDLTGAVDILAIKDRMPVVLGKILADILCLDVAHDHLFRTLIKRTVTGKAFIRSTAVTEIETNMTGSTAIGQQITVKVVRLGPGNGKNQRGCHVENKHA